MTKLLDPEPLPAGEASARPDRPDARRTVRRASHWLLIRNPMLLVLTVLVIASEMLYPGFFALDNLRNIAEQNAAIGVVALGMTIVMIAGGFDLSVGAVFALGTVIYAKSADGNPVVVAVSATLLAGALCGVTNGLAITQLKVNPFVATLGLGSVYSGIAFTVSDNQSIVPTTTGFRWFTDQELLGLPVGVEIVAALFAIGMWVLSRTVYGRNLYAVGGNQEAARLAGLRVQLLRVSTFAIVGMAAAFSGVLVAARSSVGTADLGQDTPLTAIAIVIVGGTSLFGGEGSIQRTLVGLAVIATIHNLFDRMAVSLSAQLVAEGLIVVAAVALDLLTRQRRT